MRILLPEVVDVASPNLVAIRENLLRVLLILQHHLVQFELIFELLLEFGSPTTVISLWIGRCEVVFKAKSNLHELEKLRFVFHCFKSFLILDIVFLVGFFGLTKLS